MTCRTPSRYCSFLLAPILLAVALMGTRTTPMPAAEATGLYVKKETWTETMLHTRAAYLSRVQEQRPHPATTDLAPFVSDPIEGTGPGRSISVNVSGARWLRLVTVLEGGGGNCHIWGEARLVARDKSVVKLSSLKPVLVRVGWGVLHTDRNWKDQPLRIGTREFQHGLWVHSNSDVCYDLSGKFERFEAWVGMDAARAVESLARFKVLFDGPDLLPELWKQLARDFPKQAQWFTTDAGRAYLTWFSDAASTNTEQTMLHRVLAQLGPQGDTLRKEFDALRRSKVPVGDGSWLNLYAWACRCRDCRVLLDRVWIDELRRGLEGQLADLLRTQVSPEDPRWDELQTTVGRVSAALKPGSTIDLATMRASIANLAQVLPGRLQNSAPLLARLDTLQRRWQQIVPAMTRGTASAVNDLPNLAEEARRCRHDLLLSLKGMPEYLAVPAHAGMEQEWESQYAALQHDLANRAHFARVAGETFRTEALIHDSDRDPADVVLRRTAALLADLKRTPAAPTLAGLAKELVLLQAASAAVALQNTEARYALYADACRIRRQVALHNPLLNFDRILFIKRHRSLYDHMCDQFYGMAARPGGGLYILSDAFGPRPKKGTVPLRLGGQSPFSAGPKVHDILANSVVQRGRLKGQKLSGGPNITPQLTFDGGGNLHGPDHDGGTFLSPDLSFDGRSILFAYVENKGDKQHRHHTDPSQGHWAEGRCFHIFRVNVDGTGLEQLTDGTWNDLHPCWLPNGRVAFISERRGGYLRCGRVCPIYTLYDMAADGSDITCLSFHESNEWHPGVAHDGRIIYTRWDYVDRHGCTAHMPWITTLDGRDSRALHGNFAPRPVRPDMELNTRAIAGSHKYVATATPHHGQAYGSLVLIDPRVPDDDGMGPIRRLTPEVGFPESQGGAQVYGTAWPLSEDYFLCVYDAAMAPGAGYQGSPYRPGNYGIYLVDSFGNRELIYRDPEIACLSPIPLRPTPRPPLTPELVKRGPESNPATRPPVADNPPEGTIALMNVYDTQKSWPTGTRIKELRILQTCPMSVPSGRPPHETALREASSRDSVVPIRHVLGTVPVEADGSAHFKVPADKLLFFQAIDDKGLAVTSMRSATYLHRGEQLVCAGCHEPKHRSPVALASAPLALRRAPSRLQHDVDGTNPFSYPRLVQPVLERHCVQCHAQHPGKAPSLAREPLIRNWYASYANLVDRYGFHNYGNGYRTIPGQFGARASKLYELLQKGHYDVKLSAEEMHRLTLWLDCASMFYGVYEKEGGQAQLRGEIARPTLE